ncbi:hypothetical protein [Endozoicomonas sp. ONNA2]|uniref:hypothetical protein n=1 Tax=Endozoicomonas sp. ONNA2 TaxID=2828741 RepID=UPI0021494BE0|nr:hypothetical protein [Endozoicomonas sp. ONNA2]
MKNSYLSKWGRNVNFFFDKIFINKEKHTPKTNIYDFLKNMTKRRVEVLIEEVQEDHEGKNRSDHVDKILKLTESIPKECTFFSRTSSGILLNQTLKSISAMKSIVANREQTLLY